MQGLADAVTQFMVAESLKGHATRPPPRDGRAYQAWMVGGFRKLSARWKERFLRDWGIHIADHWAMEESGVPVSVPARTELILIVKDLGPHGLTDRAAELGRRWNIPYVRIKRGAAADWPRLLGGIGLTSPPPWRKPPPAPTLTVVRAPEPEAPSKPLPSPLEESADDETAAVEPKPEEAMASAKPKSSPTRTINIKGSKYRKRSTIAGTFGESLRSLRETVGLSQREMAQLCGPDVQQTNISHWEIGIVPSFENFVMLVNVMPELLDVPEPKAGFHARYRDLPKPATVAKPAPTPTPDPAPPTVTVTNVTNMPAPTPPAPVVAEPVRKLFGNGVADAAIRYAEAVQTVAALTRDLERAKDAARVAHEELERLAGESHK